jgi:acyl-coenzyme A synthetase/AMP-(fatty) acid ligase
MNDSILSIAVFLALIHKGMIPCLLNPNSAMESYHDYFTVCQPKMLMVDPSLTMSFSRVAEINKINLFIPTEKYFNSLNAKALVAPNRGNGKRPAFCLFTSGTTGLPLAVLHRHIDVEIMNNDYVSVVLGIHDQDIIFATSRFYFAYGLNSLFMALLNKAMLILAPPILEPAVIWEIIERAKPTVFFSIPTMYSRLLRVKKGDSLIATSLRICISAGENLPPQINTVWRRITNKAIIDGIGTTEILSTFISNREDNFRLGSTGIPVPGFSAEIRDSKNQPMADGEIGVLWVKGNTYLDSYFNHPSASYEKFLDGWFKTNDLFSKDKDGFYFYHGRASEVFKVSGIWIYPYRIEQALNSHPAVLESALIRIEQESGLMRPKAFIVLKEGFNESEELSVELIALCKTKCSKQEYPHFINYIATLPKTPSGKLKRFTLRQNEYA